MRPAFAHRAAIAALLCSFAFALVPARSGAAPAPEREPRSMVARTAGPLAMTPEEQVWYGRLLAGMAASDVLVETIMTRGDSYELGRDGGNYIEALLVAFRATGDVQFLERVYELSELARGSLHDSWLDGTTDGYTAWRWLADPSNATYYGKDTNWLDESISSGNAALWAWALHANRGLDARYGVAADFWRDWLEDHFLAKWYARAGGALTAWNTPYAAFYKPDTEPRSANWRLAHYLWRLTGNTFYRDRRDEIVTELAGSNEVNPAHPTAFRWTKETDPASTNWQLVNYANYYMRVVLEMNLEGMPFFGSDANMKRFAGAFRDVVFASSMPSLSAMANNVNGDGSMGYALHAFNGFSTWDSTGFLMDLADASITGAGNYAGGGLSKAARNDVYISAYALLALSPAGPTAALVGRFDAEPLDDGTVRLGWWLSIGEDALTNVYRVTPGGERFRLSELPFAGPGPHAVVDPAPGEGGTVTYRLVEVGADGEETLETLTVALGGRGASGLRLAPAMPNPFESATRVQFDLPAAQRVRVGVFDGAGRLVRELEDAVLAAGPHVLSWDGHDAAGRPAPSGVYYLAVQTPAQRLTRRAIRVR